METEQFMQYVTGFFGVPEHTWEIRGAVDVHQGALLIQVSSDHVDIEVMRRVQERVEAILREEIGE